MGNFAKKIRDQKDKELIKRMTGKVPKHRCPECHRFTLWITDSNVKHQCIMCKLIEEEKQKELKNKDS